LDALNASAKKISRNQQRENQYETLKDVPPLVYNKKQDFWISELVVLSQDNRANSVDVGSFEEAEGQPLYSVLIGTNGAGKSTMMKEIVDFFVDLHACVNEKDQKLSFANKGRLKGIRYHIDGVEC
jgi:ABC-type antimicrobial peptide transport system ATPase subunit